VIRRLTLAAALAGALTAAGAAAATALPVSSASSHGACVAVRDIDTAYCVNNPAPGLPKPKVPNLPKVPELP
jgi:hypothetical protein